MTQGLTEFFRQKKQRADAETANVNWQQVKADWLAAIDLLYDQVRTSLQDAERQGALQMARRLKRISEEHLGEYEAPELVLSVADERVIFSPRGRNVVGASGRVDVIGEAGESMLVLQPGPRWSIVRSKYPQLQLVALD